MTIIFRLQCSVPLKWHHFVTATVGSISEARSGFQQVSIMFKAGIHGPETVRPWTKWSDAVITDPKFKIDQLSAAYVGYQKLLVYHRPQNHLVIVCQANTHQQWARLEEAPGSFRNNRAKTKHLKVKLWCNMDKLTSHIEYQIVPKEFWSNLSPTHFVHDIRHQYDITTQKRCKTSGSITRKTFINNLCYIEHCLYLMLDSIFTYTG